MFQDFSRNYQTFGEITLSEIPKKLPEITSTVFFWLNTIPPRLGETSGTAAPEPPVGLGASATGAGTPRHAEETVGIFAWTKGDGMKVDDLVGYDIWIYIYTYIYIYIHT